MDKLEETLSKIFSTASDCCDKCEALDIAMGLSSYLTVYRMSLEELGELK